MRTTCLSMLAIAAVLATSNIAAAQDYGPKDIHSIAVMEVMNKRYFDNFIWGVAKFSGVGTVYSQKTLDGSDAPGLHVDMGPFGNAKCPNIAPKGLRNGDKVRLTGTISGVFTAGTAAEWNARLKTQLPVKDDLFLLDDSCTFEKVN